MNIIKKPPLGAPVNLLHPLGQALISSWIMHEAGGRIVVDRKGRNNGNFYGTTLEWSPRGIKNFDDGATYGINCGSDSSLHPKNEFSLECTFKTRTPATGWYALPCINTTTTGLKWGSGEFGGRFVWMWWGDIDKGNFGVWTWADGTWYHAVLTLREGESANLYINGNFVGSSQNTVPTFGWNGNEEFLIGDDNNFNNDSLAIEYEQVKLYNRVLTPTEIKLLYVNPYRMYSYTPIWMFDYTRVVGDSAVGAGVLRGVGRGLFQ